MPLDYMLYLANMGKNFDDLETFLYISHEWCEHLTMVECHKRRAELYG